jgi:hypothetical protein
LKNPLTNFAFPSMAVDAPYLPALVPAIFCEVLFCFCAFGFYRYYCCKCCLRSCFGAESPDNRISFLRAFRFEDTYESHSIGLKYLLFVTRFLSFCYIFGVSTIWNYIDSGGFIWFYFTMWNVELLSIYYFFTLVCSIIGFCNRPKIMTPAGSYYVEDYTGTMKEATRQPRYAAIHWSYKIARFGRIVHVLFGVCGGSAALVTFVNFSFLDPKFEFWNVSSHLVPIVSLLVELSLNNMYVRVDSFVFNILWSWLYLIFVWPLVALGTLSFWPYKFLAADTPICFVIYTALILFNVIFYFIFYGLSFGKYYLRHGRKNERYVERDVSTDTIPGIDMDSMDVI